MLRQKRFIFAVILFISSAAWTTQAMAQDGLEEVKSPFKELNWKPGAEVAQYKRIVLLEPFVELREGWLKDQNRGKLSVRIEEDQVDIIKARLSEEFMNIFTREIEEAGYEIVNVAAADVLILRPAIVNVNIGADVFGSVGQYPNGTMGSSMTLYLEFFDAVSSTLIGRAVDGRGVAEARISGVRRIINRWSGFLNTTLEGGP